MLSTTSSSTGIPPAPNERLCRALDELAPALLPNRTDDEVYAALGNALMVLEAEHVLLAPSPTGPAVVSVRLHGVPAATARAALAPMDAPGHPLEAARLEEVRVAVRELVACVAGRAAVLEWLPLNAETGDHGVLLVGEAADAASAATHLVRLAANALAASAELRRQQVLVEQVIHLLGSLVEAKHPDSAGHAEQVAEYAVRLARLLELPEAQIAWLRVAALLHDVGKIGIPESVLNKPSRLTRAERAMMETHPALGAQLLARVEGLRRMAPLVRHHHERYDGTGYPDGLANEAIPLGARVLALADAFQAMTSRRAYRPGLTREEALEELRAGRGTQFDARLVDLFLDALAKSNGGG